MEFYIRNGGSWRQADPAKGIYVYNSGWKEAQEVWIRNGGAWHKGYQKSDPVTYTLGLNGFDPYPSRFARGTSWGTSSNGPAGGSAGTRTIACGRYYLGGNTKRYYGLMEFLFATNPNEDPELLATKMQTRPVVTSATLKLTRDTVTHGSANPSSGSIYISPYNGNTGDAAPDPADVDFSKATGAQSVVGLARGSSITIDLDQDIIDELALTGTLAVTNVNSGLNNSGASEDQSYMWFFGQNVSDTSKHPLLTVTLDYA